jgi:hypothetical protein
MAKIIKTGPTTRAITGPANPTTGTTTRWTTTGPANVTIGTTTDSAQPTLFDVDFLGPRAANPSFPFMLSVDKNTKEITWTYTCEKGTITIDTHGQVSYTGIGDIDEISNNFYQDLEKYFKENINGKLYEQMRALLDKVDMYKVTLRKSHELTHELANRLSKYERVSEWQVDVPVSSEQIAKEMQEIDATIDKNLKNRNQLSKNSNLQQFSNQSLQGFEGGPSNQLSKNSNPQQLSNQSGLLGGYAVESSDDSGP